MAQVMVNIRYVVTKAGRSTILSKKARIDTSAQVGDFLAALQEKISDLGNRGQQLFLSVDPDETLDTLGIRENDTIVVMPRSTSDIIEFE